MLMAIRLASFNRHHDLPTVSAVITRSVNSVVIQGSSQLGGHIAFGDSP
jgi:hypothetical protein